MKYEIVKESLLYVFSMLKIDHTDILISFYIHMKTVSNKINNEAFFWYTMYFCGHERFISNLEKPNWSFQFKYSRNYFLLHKMNIEEQRVILKGENWPQAKKVFK